MKVQLVKVNYQHNIIVKNFQSPTDSIKRDFNVIHVHLGIPVSMSVTTVLEVSTAHTQYMV